MPENQKNQMIYYYVEGNVRTKEVIKLKNKEIFYNEKSEELNSKSPLVVGITRFKKEKKNKPAIWIGNNSYKIEKIKTLDQIDGFFETSSGEYVAFYVENITIYFLLPLFWILAMIIWLIAGQILPVGIIDSERNDKENNWIIGGIEGTDISLQPEVEESYNTYWGYQEIIIDKKMKVPFVNKETNTAYAQFSIYDKVGNLIYQSPMIKPGTHDEWDAYKYYKGKSGKYLHDLKVVFFNPVTNKKGEIIDFEASMFSATTPDFSVTIQ